MVLFFFQLPIYPKQHNSLPGYYRTSRSSRPKRPAFSMYSHPCNYPRHHYNNNNNNNNWPSQSSLCSTNYYYYHYASSKNLCRKGLQFDNNSNNTHDALLAEKTGVPIVFEEDEPIYYDCDFSTRKFDNFDRNFDLRGLTIKEELYGEV